MLDQQFKHKHWFKGETMTNKQFLDYVLKHEGNFIAIPKLKSKSNVLGEVSYYWLLSDRRYSMQLDYDMILYLMQNSEYFSNKFTTNCLTTLL